MSDARYLAIYLSDHLAGAIAGWELAKRATKNNQGTPLEAFVSRLATDIDDDRQSLEKLMREMGIRKDLLKDAAAWVAEKVGRLKFNEKLIGYSGLSRLVELEGLSLGVEGKLTLWRNLMQIRGRYPALAGDRLDEFMRRAENQREEAGEGSTGGGEHGAVIL